MSDNHAIPSPAGEFIMFASDDGAVRIECRFESESLWLSQAMICQLFGKAKATISEHIKNIFDDGELNENSVVRFYRTTADDGKNYNVQHYSLPLILAIGYRVREIFALAADYLPSLKETTQFFQTIQNKLHFACTGHTAAELIHQRADAAQPNMGLTSFKNEEVRKSDVTVAKNYLNAEEVSELNRVVNMWLDFAEDQARRRQQIFLHDWQDKLDQFLQFNDRDVLIGTGSVSKKMADEKAHTEYSQFAEQQRRLKEAEGEKNIMELLKWQQDTKG